ncbi:hypothetical protein [Paenibacillus sp. 1P07SE]|uniref:hypothetical protein n=1 Tax=Paenibacillus sp. 1P07SE TaxID=3132209 RepID=UPI0039A61272
MLKPINEQLADLRLMVRHQQNWKERLERIVKEMEPYRQEIRSLRRRLEEEAADGTQSAQQSFGRMVLSLLSGGRRRLSKRQAEALRMKLQLEEAEDTLAFLERERAELIAKLADIGQADRRYEELLLQKRQLILAHFPDLAGQLEQLTDQENTRLADCKELEDALRIGQGVIYDLERASQALHAAENYGNWDMLGGGLMAGVAKHGHIDSARTAIHAAQDGLRRFAEEVEDVNRDIQIRIEVGGALTFADFFFDGLTFDWIVQGRIHSSQQEVLRKLYQLKGIVNTLTREAGYAQGQLLDIQGKIKALIENS